MISLTITNQKAFTRMLFLEDSFDCFGMTEAVFRTFATYHIEGDTLADYYPEPPKETHAMWEQIRPVGFSMIKGNRLPLSFHISLCAADCMIQEVCQAAQTSLPPEMIEALFFNINYRDGIIRCTTAVSLKTFTLDKTLERVWDKYMIAYLDYHEVDYQQDI